MEDRQSTHCVVARPRSPLVFRSGRPFGQGGASGGSHGFAFPMPATMAGAVRAAWADAAMPGGPGSIDHDALRAMAIRGPLLVRVAGSHVLNWLLPQPADSAYLEDQRGAISVVAAKPNAAPGFGCDLPHGLWPVCLAGDEPHKALVGQPFWALERVGQWLGEPRSFSPRAEQVHTGPVQSTRTHVGLDPDSRSAKEGLLFQSGGYAFGPVRSDQGWKEETLALAAFVSDEMALGLDKRVCRMGADGRSVRYHASTNLPGVPAVLKQRLNELGKGGLARLMLATPAVFRSGWHPDWLGATSQSSALVGEIPGTGVEVRLRAAALGRRKAHSGWSMQVGQQKSVRRVVPAGTIYWLELLSAPAPDVLADLWLRSVVSERQDGLDGWGLCLPGLGEI